MWFKKLSLLKFNKKVGATQVVETLGYFKGETRTINKGKAECECEERHSGSLCGHRAAVLPPDRAPRGGCAGCAVGTSPHGEQEPSASASSCAAERLCRALPETARTHRTQLLAQIAQMLADGKPKCRLPVSQWWLQHPRDSCSVCLY